MRKCPSPPMSPISRSLCGVIKEAVMGRIGGVWEVVAVLFLAVSGRKAVASGIGKHGKGGRSSSSPSSTVAEEEVGYCLSWRLSVEANNMAGWRTVPNRCLMYIESYMLGGQYDRDVDFIVDQVSTYVQGLVLPHDGFDAWVLDVDDTCLSNLFYYKGKRFGCDPYDPPAFKAWALRGGCPAISAMLGLFNTLVDSGFKVFLITGRDEQNFSQVTIDNLHNQGFIGYERLILRRAEHKGVGAIQYKSGIRKELVGEGYRIWGNLGDQWSDLQGDYKGNRTFKLPNPMYFVP